MKKFLVSFCLSILTLNAVYAQDIDDCVCPRKMLYGVGPINGTGSIRLEYYGDPSLVPPNPLTQSFYFDLAGYPAGHYQPTGVITFPNNPLVTYLVFDQLYTQSNNINNVSLEGTITLPTGEICHYIRNGNRDEKFPCSTLCCPNTCEAMIDRCGQSLLDLAGSLYQFNTSCKQWEGSCNEFSTIYRMGKVGFGSPPPPDFQAAIRGSLFTERIHIQKTAWCDYVFEKDYPLPPLDTVEDFIRREKHLPDFPSGTEIIAAQGFDVGEITNLQQKKIEELFLYLIELDEEVSKFEKTVKK